MPKLNSVTAYKSACSHQGNFVIQPAAPEFRLPGGKGHRVLPQLIFGLITVDLRGHALCVSSFNLGVGQIQYLFQRYGVIFH